MPSINGLKRRGYTPEAINNFVDEIGVTRRGNDKFTNVKLLELHLKKCLDPTATRVMVVIDPLTLKITNLPEQVAYDAPLFPREPDRGSRTVTLTNTIYIERKDFRDTLTEDFWGLAPGQMVGLKYASYALKFVERVGDEVRV
jgi:glutaminyl-tRNA synthetase